MVLDGICMVCFQVFEGDEINKIKAGKIIPHFRGTEHHDKCCDITSLSTTKYRGSGMAMMSIENYIENPHQVEDIVHVNFANWLVDNCYSSVRSVENGSFE